MSTKKAAAPKAPADQNALTVLASDLPRQQLAIGTRSACALFRGFESMRKIQQRTAHHALAQYQAAAERLRQPCNPVDVLMLQAELLRFDMDEAARYWQQLFGPGKAANAGGVATSALEMQQMVLDSMAATLREESEEAVGNLQALAAAVHQPFGGDGRSGQAAH